MSDGGTKWLEGLGLGEVVVLNVGEGDKVEYDASVQINTSVISWHGLCVNTRRSLSLIFRTTETQRYCIISSDL